MDFLLSSIQVVGRIPIFSVVHTFENLGIRKPGQAYSPRSASQMLRSLCRGYFVPAFILHRGCTGIGGDSRGNSGTMY